MIECNDKPFVTRELDIKSNGTYSTIGYDQANVDVAGNTLTQEKTFNNGQITGTFFVEPDPGYLLSKVTINITPAFSLYDTGYDDVRNSWLDCGIAEQIDWTINYWGGGHELSGNCDEYFRFGEQYESGKGIHDKILVFIPNFQRMQDITSAKYMFADNVSLVLVPNYCDFSNCYSAEGAFSYCTALPRIKKLSLAWDCNSMFSGCMNLEYIDEIIQPDGMARFMNGESMFYDCQNLKSLPEIDCYWTENIMNMLMSCPKLTDVGGFKDLGNKLETGQTLDLSMSSRLTDESINNILSKLYNLKTIAPGDKTATIIFAKSVYARITQEQIQEAGYKGWTIEES